MRYVAAWLTDVEIRCCSVVDSTSACKLEVRIKFLARSNLWRFCITEHLVSFHGEGRGRLNSGENLIVGLAFISDKEVLLAPDSTKSSVTNNYQY